MKCEIGDIVLATKFTYPNGNPGTLHSVSIEPNNIIMKVGTVTKKQYLRFAELFEESLT